MGRVVSINISKTKGIRKTPVKEAFLLQDHGIEGDAHAGGERLRQVSLLSIESIKKMQDLGAAVGPGDFAENITVQGIDLLKLPIGTKMEMGDCIEAEVTQIGKKCHTRCAIYEQAGDCVMPKEGIFVRILKSGTLRQGDSLRVKT